MSCQVVLPNREPAVVLVMEHICDQGPVNLCKLQSFPSDNRTPVVHKMVSALLPLSCTVINRTRWRFTA